MIDIRDQLETCNIMAREVLHNGSTAELVEAALQSNQGVLHESGALVVSSGLRKGRSPTDKRIVENPESQHDIGWGDHNMPLRPMSYRMNRRRAIDYLNTQPRLYVVDGFAGCDPSHRLKVRLITARPSHALCMKNTVVRPSAIEQSGFGQPDFVILHAGAFPADPLTPDVSSPVSVNINFEAREIVILGTDYAGEIKNGLFSVMNYQLPARDVLTMHCAANQGPRGDVSLFFGLSGTGKTSLAMEPQRALIGDNEHGWSEDGVFSLEGGCYAKCAGLSRERDPALFDAVRFGCVLENVAFQNGEDSSCSRHINFDDTSITENARVSFPMESFANARIPGRVGHPTNIILLTCDALGVLPPVSQLTPEQADYHFINGYSAKMPGTEVGVHEPTTTFSPGFGAAFLTRPSKVYADLFAARIRKHQPRLWLVNTGWTGGDFRHGQRIPIEETRAIIAAIHDGSLLEVPYETEPIFGLVVPTQCPGVASQRLWPRKSWANSEAYDAVAWQLRERFTRNFDRIEHAPIQLAGHTACYHRTGI